MRTFLFVIACIAALALVGGCGDDECDPCAPVVQEQPLALLDAGMGGGGSYGTDTLWVFFVSSNNDTLFSLLVTENDDGTSVTIDAGLYPELENAAATFTDGVDDSWTFWVRLYPGGGGGGTGTYESRWIEGGLTGEYDPDLHGAEVTGVIVRLDDVIVDNQGGWTDYSVQARIIIMGKP
jgi:hypothetical protein